MERFGLGRLEGEPVRVPGGLSNELWRVRTGRGDFAVKRMVVNARLPEFVGNVEAAYAVEQRAWAAGVPMPEPVPVDGRALVRVDGELYRVHRWVEGKPGAQGQPKAEGKGAQGQPQAEGKGAQGQPQVEGTAAQGRPQAEGTAAQGRPQAEGTAAEERPQAEEKGVQARRARATADSAAELLADIHAAGRPRRRTLPGLSWDGRRWGGKLINLAQRVAGGPRETLVVYSHRDLDPKNTLRDADGRLLAVDWDAAGPISAIHEAVALALDWRDWTALATYEQRTGRTVPAEPWIFGGWVAAQGGWLDHTADDGTRAALLELAESLDDLITELGRPPARPAS
ncbi:hypothetical protein BKA14_006247 [Actinoplanes abujensis]|uniref:Aminoglycoside phosphotransferase domain-containing protein n=1 Tax=Paractinoplanes abujensis TaxID=882441 RepID=A0A7W7G4Z4_9ACTN|nr:hypothetical protein [Actinoplanes abujensis]